MLSLYRSMLRYRRHLELTDHDYYVRYLKREFQRFERDNPTRELVKKRYDKGRKVLESGMGGLV